LAYGITTIRTAECVWQCVGEQEAHVCGWLVVVADTAKGETEMKHIKKVSVVKAQDVLSEIIAVIEDCIAEIADILKKDSVS
jgi:hypothetical protein